MKLAIVGPPGPLCTALTTHFSQAEDYHLVQQVRAVDALLVVAGETGATLQKEPEWNQLLQPWVETAVPRVVMLSSAEIYPASHRHPGMLAEREPVIRGHQPMAKRWQIREQALVAAFRDTPAQVVILRPVPVPLPDGQDFFSRLLRRRFFSTSAGYDPSLQLLALEDLVSAVQLAMHASIEGVFNLAPAGVVPLRKALARARTRRLPLPWSLRGLVCRIFAAPRRHALLGLHLRIRYPWTVSGEKARLKLGFHPRYTSLDAIARLHGEQGAGEDQPNFDDFGQENSYVDFHGRGQFRFLHDLYWRVSLKGLEHVPRSGAGILVGVHRGFMPYDGTMILHKLAREIGRYPRTLVHPSLTKPPFLSYFITRLGGLIACVENGDHVLSRQLLLSIFPEGIQGAFTPYKQAYKLQRFGRGEYVRMALRHQVPIIPFITVGSAEIYPILAGIHWRWLRRITEWPFFPITPTFPLLPVPLPAKWHTQILPPIRPADRYPPEAAEDTALVSRLDEEIKEAMQAALDDLRKRRKWIFWGKIPGF